MSRPLTQEDAKRRVDRTIFLAAQRDEAAAEVRRLRARNDELYERIGYLERQVDDLEEIKSCKWCGEDTEQHDDEN